MFRLILQILFAYCFGDSDCLKSNDVLKPLIEAWHPEKGIWPVRAGQELDFGEIKSKSRAWRDLDVSEGWRLAFKM